MPHSQDHPNPDNVTDNQLGVLMGICRHQIEASFVAPIQERAVACRDRKKNISFSVDGIVDFDES